MPSSDMDVDRPKSRESDGILTENTDDFIIGDRVWVHGTKPGYIQYLGEVQFSPGDWAGVVLDDHSGKNDGSVAGVKYFQCEPKRGVFARLHKLTRYPLVHATSPSGKLMCDSPTPPPIQRCLTPTSQRCLTPTRTPSPGARNLREGDRVTISSSSGPPKTGVLRYIGQTDFAAGEWAGVELDDPLGKNDGTVAGKRYFKCSPNYGLFAPSHKVTKITGSLDRHRRTHHNSGSEVSNSSKNSSIINIQDDHRKYAEESEKRAQRLRQLLEVAEAERRDLATKLEEERRKVEELEFRIEEECIGKDDLEAEREKEKRKIEDLERRLEQEMRKNEMISDGATPDGVLQDQIKRSNEDIVSLKEKLRQSENKIQELQSKKLAAPIPSLSNSQRSDELLRKDEALLQAQLSLDNKRREVQNLLDRISELEKDLEKSKSRQSRQLDTIDELNVKLQKAVSKCSALEEEILSNQEKTDDLERRLRASSEQVSHLESEKRRLEEQVLSPESTPKEQALLSRVQEREKEIADWRKEAEEARKELDKSRKEREKTRKEFEERIRSLKDEHEEDFRKQKKRASESEEANKIKIRDLEKSLSQLRIELESARAEADVRLSRQEIQIQESKLKSENVDRLRDQISRLQAEKDLIRVEKEEMWKRLQTSEKTRQRWESEANKASDEVNLLKSQVQHLRTEFMTHREDLVKKLAETEFDSKAVQDLHMQIEEQRRIVEQMTQRLKWTEGERDQLHKALSSRQQDQIQIENGLRQEMDTLKRRLVETEAEKQSLTRSLEATQLLIEEKSASFHQHQRDEVEKLKEDKAKLEKKITDLHGELSIVRNGNSESSSHITQIIKDKEALEQQVNFLNSVIVDMQHKNDDLKSRLDILETEVIFDGHLALGIPTRSSFQVFCDICGIYSMHDTEDCPKQRSIKRNQSYSSQESEF